MSDKRIYQVSTLQALSLGYTRPVVKVGELLAHGHTGLGTFEGVNGEMIVLDGICYQAKEDGKGAYPIRNLQWYRGLFVSRDPDL